MKRMTPRRYRGLTLLELMIAMALGLLVILAVTQVFLAARQGYRLQESIGRLQENARFVTDTLARELRHADFWGGIQPENLNRHASLANPGTPCSEPWMADIAFPLRAYAGAASSPLAGCTVSGYIPNTDVIVVRYADPAGYVPTTFLTAPPPDPTRLGRLFVRTRLGRNGLLFPFDQRAGALTSIPGDESEGVFTYRFAARTYFIRETTNGQPALFIRQLNSAGVSNSEQLVDGVEMLRFQFGVDDDGDAIIDRYLSTADMLVTDWRRALVIRAAVIIRGDALDDFVDDASYTFPDGYVYTPPANARRFPRRLFVQDIQVRNRLDRS